MAGTRRGGARASKTNRKLYGDDFYRLIGAIGGRNGRTGGFYANRELAAIAGAKGGKISKRRPASFYKNHADKPKKYQVDTKTNNLTLV